MSIRGKIIGALALVGTAGITISTIKNKVLENEKKSEGLRVIILSGINYLSPNMISDCDDFKKAKIKSKKLLEESSAILDSALERIKKEKADVLILCGNLTKDGELEGHNEISEKLMLLKKEEDLKIYVVNGANDINNFNAKDFSKGREENTTQTTLENFKEIYKYFRAKDDDDIFKPVKDKGGSLSYVVSPKEGYTIIAVDSCIYSNDKATEEVKNQKLIGRISDELRTWIIEKARNAESKGNTVILVLHHGLVPPASEDYDFFIDKYNVLNKEFADAGIRYVLSESYNDSYISSIISEKEKSLYNISTGSVISYPCEIRTLNFNHKKVNHKLKETVEIINNPIKSIEFIDKTTGGKIVDLPAYYYKEFTSLDYFIRQGKLYTEDLLHKIEKTGGLENYLSKVLNKDIGEYILENLANKLPTQKDDAVHVEEKIKVYLDRTSNTIVIMCNVFYKKVKFNITSYAIKKEIVSRILKQIDDRILSDKTYMDSFVENIIRDLFNTNFYNDDGMKRNAEDLLKSIYESIIKKDSNIESWIIECAANFSNGRNIDVLLNTMCRDLTMIILKEAPKLTYEADRIVSRASGITSKVIRKRVLSILGKNLDDMIKFINIDINDKVLDFILLFLQDDKREKYSSYISEAIMSMTKKIDNKNDDKIVITI